MSDLTSRSALIEELDYYISHTNETSGEHYAYKQAKRLVEEQPSVEPVRGEWMFTPTFNEYECSNCKSMISLSDDANAHPNFCPNCGADMRKDVQ